MAAWQEAEDGAWRFARITDDQNEALFDEVDVDLSLPPAPRPEDWVTDWVEVLALLEIGAGVRCQYRASIEAITGVRAYGRQARLGMVLCCGRRRAG